MNADHDKQSELQKMLALKKHEAPPSRFSNGFSETVIDRLQHPESPGEQTFSQRFLQAMEKRDGGASCFFKASIFCNSLCLSWSAFITT